MRYILKYVKTSSISHSIYDQTIKVVYLFLGLYLCLSSVFLIVELLSFFASYQSLWIITISYIYNHFLYKQQFSLNSINMVIAAIVIYCIFGLIVYCRTVSNITQRVFIFETFFFNQLKYYILKPFLCMYNFTQFCSLSIMNNKTFD